MIGVIPQGFVGPLGYMCIWMLLERQVLDESTSCRVIDAEESGLLQPQAANEQGGAWDNDLVQLVLPAMILSNLLFALQRFSPDGSEQMLRAIEVLIQPNPTQPVDGREFEVLVAHMVRNHQFAAVLTGEPYIPLSELLPGVAGDEKLLQMQVKQQAISSLASIAELGTEAGISNPLVASEVRG